MRSKFTFLLITCAAAVVVSGQAPQPAVSKDSLAKLVWVDPSTGLMWAAKDNGKDISWRGAMKYCRSLRLDGYSGWRLADMAELLSIYERDVEALGMAGNAKSREAFAWHVKGNLFLTGDEWGGRQVTGRIPLESYEQYFDFNEGRPNTDATGWPYPSSGRRALCVRSAGK